MTTIPLHSFSIIARDSFNRLDQFRSRQRCGRYVVCEVTAHFEAVKSQ